MANRRLEKALIPTTETEIKADLCAISRQMRDTQRQLQGLNATWTELVSRRIELEHALRRFDIHRAERAV